MVVDALRRQLGAVDVVLSAVLVVALAVRGRGGGGGGRRGGGQREGDGGGGGRGHHVLQLHLGLHQVLLHLDHLGGRGRVQLGSPVLRMLKGGIVDRETADDNDVNPVNTCEEFNK